MPSSCLCTTTRLGIVHDDSAMFPEMHMALSKQSYLKKMNINSVGRVLFAGGAGK